MTNKEKEVFQQYDKAHQAADELRAAIENDGSISDCEIFNDIIVNNPHGKELISRLTSKEHHEQFANTVKQLNQKEDTKKFYKRLEQEVRKKRNRKILLTAISISSCAAVLLCSLWILMQEEPTTVNSNKVTVSNNVNSEVTEPTIILANGESVPLCQLSNSTQQNNDVIIEESGNIKLTHSTLRDSIEGEIRYNTLVMPIKNKRIIILGDGTEIYLNAGSKLVYPVGSHSSMREVQLEGEAFFKVTKSDKPFTVRMGTSSVKVYGTRFNLRNLMGEIETVLVEGKVGFSSENQKEIIMIPNQKLNYNIKNRQSYIETVNAENYTLWMNDFFSFKDQTLERILYDISSWYGITITTRPELMNKQLTLVQSRNVNSEEVLKFITEILNVKLVVQGKEEYHIE